MLGKKMNLIWTTNYSAVNHKNLEIKAMLNDEQSLEIPELTVEGQSRNSCLNFAKYVGD